MWSAGKLNLPVIQDAYNCSVSYLRQRKEGSETAAGVSMDLQTGFVGNPPLQNWYHTHSNTLVKLTVDELFEKIKVRFLGDNWAEEFASLIGTTKQGSERFREYGESAQADNAYLLNNAAQLSTATLIDCLKSNMAPYLIEKLRENTTRSKEIASLGNKLCKEKATGDESLDMWIGLVNDLDEEVRSHFKNYEFFSASSVKRSASTAGIGKGSTTSAATTFPFAHESTAFSVAAAPTNNPRWAPGNAPSGNTGTSTSTGTWSQGGSAWVPGGSSSSYSSNASTNPNTIDIGRYPKRISEDERAWILFTGGCLHCRCPWQCHWSRAKGQPQICPACPATNYEEWDVDFIRKWIERYPNGYDTTVGRAGRP